jgi:cytidine deaminase
MTSDADQLEKIVEQARAVREQAHAPYSKFRVGAAVQSASGKVYLGCNVENASYGATVCAERNAIGAMVAAGESALSLVVVFTDADTPTMPCGICRQAILEFADDVRIVAVTPSAREETTLRALLPKPFVFSR